MKYKLSILFIVIICSEIFCQKIFNEIVLFNDTTKLAEYPFSEKYDSLISKLEVKPEQNLKNNSRILIDYFPVTPELLAKVDGKILSPQDYAKYILNEIPANLWVAVNLKVHWDGSIINCKINAYENPKPDVKLIEKIVRRFKGKPIMNEANFPNPGPFNFSWVIRGKNRK